MDLGALAGRVRFVLADPSNPGNIGAAARAIKTMGFRNLWVSNPRVRNYKEDVEAVKLSTQALDVLQESHSVDTLSEALKGVRFAWALSGYDHKYGPRICTLHEAAEASAELLDRVSVTDEESDIAFVFGTERDGLSNAEILLTQGIAAIPADSEMPSLNLAQAVQVCAYEMREVMRKNSGTELLDWEVRFKDGVPAGAESVEGLVSHLKEALTVIGMTTEDDPRKMMPRLRSIFLKASPTKDDVVLLRAICAAIIKPRTGWQEKSRLPEEAHVTKAGWKAGKAS